MAILRIRTQPIESGKPHRYLTKDLSVLAKKRLKIIKFGSFFLIASIILNAYLIYH